ncbi:anthranilate synthase component I family protein [Phycisphaeraceae bacterium D3-23]
MPAVFGEGLQIDWRLTPLDAMARWPADLPVFLMHSGRLDPRWSRYSVLAQPVGALRFTGERTEHIGPGDPFTHTVWRDHPLTDLRQALRHDAGRSLWLGYLGYDTGRWIEHLPAGPTDDRGWPVMQFERCTGWLVYDGLHRIWTAHGSYAEDGPPRLDDPPAATQDTPGFSAGPPQPQQPRADYEQGVQRVLDYIAAGDVFQVNLTQRLTSAFAGDPRALFAALARVSPAWYGCYGELTRFNDHEPAHAIASTSPELFLELDHDGGVVTRPIKGTRPSTTPADELRNSAKDAAELNMIIDLMRNDLGRVCTYGSVQVAQPRTIESHPTVHHGVATVAGRLHPSKDLVDLLRATMPGGSITGAPKVRAMQIIDELEPVRRGPYCGTLGMIHGDAMRMNIAIRTMLIEQPTESLTAIGADDADSGNDLAFRGGRVDFSVGGGIVADSTPTGEYEETMAKASAMLTALGAEKNSTYR